MGETTSGRGLGGRSLDLFHFLFASPNFLFAFQTLQMGIKHFSGLFVMLCVGVALSLLTTVAEHLVYKVVIPRVHEPRLKYWLHTSQVGSTQLPPRRAKC